MIPLMKTAFMHEDETKEALAEFIRGAPRLSMHLKCLEFEEAFAGFQGRSYATLFNSGGSANLALFQALKNLGRLQAGATIGISALTWATNVMPIIQLGMVPLAIDCDPKTLNVMSHSLRKTLETHDLDCLFITNAMGFAGDLNELRGLCESEDILFLEDNCEALGTEMKDRVKAGNFGAASTFSFFVAHHMSTIEGGMVCTDDEELSTMLKIVRANGWDRNLDSSTQFSLRSAHEVVSEFEAKYTFYDLGYNLRPTEITGFLGLCQLGYLAENIPRREANYSFLQETVADNQDLVQLDRSHIEVLSNFAFPVLCHSSEAKEKYAAQFAGAGVEIRPMIAGNIQRQPFYRKYVSQLVDLPGADFVHTNGFYCGNYPELTRMDLETLKSCLRRYV